MTRHSTRRAFLTGTVPVAAASGAALCLGARLALAETAAAKGASPDPAVQEQLLLDWQRRQARDRAVLFTRLIKSHGASILDEVTANTIEQTRLRLANAELELRNLAGVKTYLWDAMGAGFSFTCVTDSPTRLQYKVTACFLAEEMLRHDAGTIGSAFYCAYDVGFCQGLSRSIRFTRTQTLMAGAPCCDHTYELG